jgi:hypothetical protein
MKFQKASSFSKITRLPGSWLSQFVKSIPELPEIFIEKWTTNKEITLATLIKTAVPRPELRTLQDLCHWKVGIFLKMVSSSTTWFSRFAERISKPIGIRIEKLRKTVLIAEISPSALLPKVVVSCTKLRIAQG